jgi:hypothetical protein
VVDAHCGSLLTRNLDALVLSRAVRMVRNRGSVGAVVGWCLVASDKIIWSMDEDRVLSCAQFTWREALPKGFLGAGRDD